MGEFKTQQNVNRTSFKKNIVVWDDVEVDRIYDTVSNLRIDIDNKLKELKAKLTEIDNEMGPIYKKYIETDMDDPKYEELEDAYMELLEKSNALDDVISSLDTLKDMMDY